MAQIGTDILLASQYLKEGNINKSLKISLSAHLNAQNLGYPTKIKKTSFLLSEIYKELRGYEKSLEMYKLSIQMNDSIINEKNQKAAIIYSLKTKITIDIFLQFDY